MLADVAVKLCAVGVCPHEALDRVHQRTQVVDVVRFPVQLVHASIVPVRVQKVIAFTLSQPSLKRYVVHTLLSEIQAYAKLFFCKL